MSGDLSHPGALLAFTADMRGVNIAVDLMAKDLMAMDIMATAARRRQGHSPVRRRPSSNSRRKRSPATPTRRSASKPGRPRTVTKHNQQNKIEIAKKGIRFGSLSHLLQSPTTLPNAPEESGLRAGRQQPQTLIGAVGCDRQHHMPKRHRAALKLLLRSLPPVFRRNCYLTQRPPTVRPTEWRFLRAAIEAVHDPCASNN